MAVLDFGNLRLREWRTVVRLRPTSNVGKLITWVHDVEGGISSITWGPEVKPVRSGILSKFSRAQFQGSYASLLNCFGTF